MSPFNSRTAASNGRRTRSQLSIPDFDVPLSRSPLKTARTALKDRQPDTLSGNSQFPKLSSEPAIEVDIAMKAPTDSDVHSDGNESEDEIMLSPTKKKRPSSSFSEGVHGDEISSIEERETKRPRHDVTPRTPHDYTETHSPISSPLPLLSRDAQKATYRSSQPPETVRMTKKPVSVDASRPNGRPQTPKRARSVPPQFLLSGCDDKVPHLDLSTPFRSRSRSPSKSVKKLRIFSVPSSELDQDAHYLSPKEKGEGRNCSVAEENMKNDISNAGSGNLELPSSPAPAAGIPSVVQAEDPGPSAKDIQVKVNDVHVGNAPSLPPHTPHTAAVFDTMDSLSPLTPLPFTSVKPPRTLHDWGFVAKTPLKAPALLRQGTASAPLSQTGDKSSMSAASHTASRLPRPSSALMPPPSSIPLRLGGKGKEKESQTGAKTTKSRQNEKSVKTIPVSGRLTRSASLRQKQSETTAGKASKGNTGSDTVTSPERSTGNFTFSFQAPTSSSVNKARGKVQSSPTKPKSTFTIPSLSTHASSSSSTSIPTPTSAEAATQPRSQSSLHTLSNALQKLSLPRPERPDTSLGFRENEHEMEGGHVPSRGKDDGFVGMTTIKPNESMAGLGLGRPSGLKKAATVGEMEFSSRSKVPFLPSGKSKPDSKSTKPPMTSSFKARVNGSQSTMTSVNRFRAGSGFRSKASQKTSLPSVAASPVKGHGDASETADISDLEEQDGSDMEILDGAKSIKEDGMMNTKAEQEFIVPLQDEDVKDKAKGKDISRRASLASQALSQSLSAFPEPDTSSRAFGTRYASSTYPVSSAAVEAGTRSAPGALNGKFKSPPITRVPATAPKNAATSSNGAIGQAAETVGKVLKDCTIFVDVRTESGEDAGGLFVDMLRGMGARILGRAGQSCTHIIFKNGLMSTLTRYRLLNEPRPLVVGIAWVVECVEQRARVDEAKFKIDLEGANVAGVNKRRRSMLPKHLTEMSSPMSTSSQEDIMKNAADQSFEGSSSSFIDVDEGMLPKRTKDEWDSLPPLERARRRRLMLDR